MLTIYTVIALVFAIAGLIIIGLYERDNLYIKTTLFVGFIVLVIVYITLGGT